MTDGTNGENLSRRDMIKRVAVGTAAVWAAPAILQTTSAYAQAGSECGPAFVCNGPIVPCGESATPTLPCLCITTVEGDRFCSNDFFCGETRACTSSDQCPPGWRCQAATGAGCCGRVCVPPCGTAIPPTGRRRIRRNSRG